MKLYLLSQKENYGYDKYDSCVVCAESENDAKKITPSGEEFSPNSTYYNTWAHTWEGIKCEEIGEANSTQKRGVVLASFNAG